MYAVVKNRTLGASSATCPPRLLARGERGTSVRHLMLACLLACMQSSGG
jgi:hypothetical protein